MNIFKDKYEQLTDELTKRNKTLKGLEIQLQEKKEENKGLDTQLSEYKTELWMLKSERHEIITKKDGLVNKIAGITMLTVTAIMFVLTFKIAAAFLPVGVIKRVLFSLMSISLGGSLNMLTVMLIKAAADKIKDKLHIRNSNRNKCIELSNEISKKEELISQKTSLRELKQKEIDDILKNIQEEKRLSKVAEETLKSLVDEIVASVVGAPTYEEGKVRPYTKVRVKED